MNQYCVEVNSGIYTLPAGLRPIIKIDYLGYFIRIDKKEIRLTDEEYEELANTWNSLH